MRVDENDLRAPESKEVRPESASGPCIYPAAMPRAHTDVVPAPGAGGLRGVLVQPLI